MKNQNMLQALLWAALIFLTWNIIAQRIWPPPPPEKSTGQPDSVVHDQGSDADWSGTPSDQQAGEGLIVPRAGEAKTVVIGQRDLQVEPGVGIQLTLSSVGAAIRDTILTNMTVDVEEGSPPYPLLSPQSTNQAGEIYSYATVNLHVVELGVDVPLDRVPWQVERVGENETVFAIELIRDGQAVLRLRKTYRVPETDLDPRRYDVLIDTEVTNVSGEPLSVILTQRGPVGLRKEDPRMDYRALYVGRRVEGVVQSSAGELIRNKATVNELYVAAPDAPPLVWTAVANKYFVAFEVPQNERRSDEPADWVTEVRRVDLGPNTDTPPLEVVTYQTVSKALALSDRQSRVITSDCFLGPKRRKAFTSIERYKQLGFDEQVLASYAAGACCSVLAFKPLTVFMINLLNLFQIVVHNYGIAIILLVLIVRTLLHPITKKSQVNMVRMQEQTAILQPKIEELKKKYANDKTKLNQETMKVYQETGINPAAQMFGCLPMLLQMPIWIALYTSLNLNIDMRHEPFLFWIRDLTAPDALIRFSGSYNVPVLGAMMGPITSFNLLPILVSLFMFFQQKLMPKPQQQNPSSSQSDQAAQMQKIMPYMTLFIGLFFYNMPSGLNLYIGASSLFGTIEQWRIRKHVKEMKEKKEQAAPLDQPDQAKNKRPKKPTLFQRLQKMAAEAEKIESGKKKKKH